MEEDELGMACSIHNFLSENLKGRDYLEDLGINGKVISKWFLREYRKVWTGYIWLKTGISGRL
jgi:hypothetical protein